MIRRLPKWMRVNRVMQWCQQIDFTQKGLQLHTNLNFVLVQLKDSADELFVVTNNV
jgi:hypothetical protein